MDMQEFRSVMLRLGVSVVSGIIAGVALSHSSYAEIYTPLILGGFIGLIGSLVGALIIIEFQKRGIERMMGASYFAIGVVSAGTTLMLLKVFFP